MKQSRVWVLGLLLCMGAGPGEGHALTGRIFLGFQGQAPAALMQVTMEGQDPARTDSHGVFRLSLPAGTPIGKRVRLEITKPGWCILSPANGEVVVPEDLGKYLPVQVRLLQSSSKQRNTEDCIARLIEAAANRPRSAAAGQKPEPIDLPRELRAFAAQKDLQLTEEQARAALDRWLNEVKTQGTDPHLLGLARFADRQFAEARQLFLRAAKEEKQRRAQATDRMVRDYRLAGDAALEEHNFEAALTAYQEAQEPVSRSAQPELWADLAVSLGMTHRELGIRVAPPGAQQHLAAAVFYYQQALQVYTKEQLPQDWAQTQNNLGNVRKQQGERTDGAEGQRLLREAVQAYGQALQVLTREHLPQGWAMTQNNLGSALQAQARRANGAESRRLLGEAVQAYRQVLQVRTREQQPQGWARIQNNLGAALQEQGERADGAEGLRLLGEAVQAYRQALQVRTREQQPQDWAMTQDNLGIALQQQGERADGAESLRLLAEAVQAYRQALQVRTREYLPQDWATTQNNLGNALQEQGERAEGAESLRLLAEAMQAYRQALQVRTREQLPQHWAMTQGNLGSALQEQGKRAEGAESLRLLGEAVQAYRQVLYVYTREHWPQYWERTQNNLSTALREQASRAPRGESQRLLGEAAEIYRLLLENSPEDVQIFTTLLSLYQEQLFEFDKAYALLAGWLKRHPEDLDNQANFAEAQLMTGRIAAAALSLDGLLRRSEQAPWYTGLKTLEVVAQTALGTTKDMPARLRSLREAVAAQPAQREPGWSFAAVKAFLARDGRLAARRGFLLELITAMEKPDRVACLSALDAVIAHSPTTPPN